MAISSPNYSVFPGQNHLKRRFIDRKNESCHSPIYYDLDGNDVTLSARVEQTQPYQLDNLAHLNRWALTQVHSNLITQQKVRQPPHIVQHYPNHEK